MSRFVPVDQEDPMRTLCRMVANTRYEDLPSSTISCAKQSILDTIAITIGGSAMEGIPAVVDLVKDRGGKPESFIPFYGGKVPASEAAFAIGPMSRAMDMGDIHEESGHCSEYTLPTMLAATGLRDKVSGKEFITAFVVGQEVLIRIGMAFQVVKEALPRGLSGGCAIFGCVAAAGKLLDLKLEELENAEGIARGMTQPHDQAMTALATLMVRIHHGFVCQDAINACLLAKRGITGPRQQVLTGFRGYLGLARWETKPLALTEALGEKWEGENVMLKPYASGKFTHTAIDGVLEQMREHQFRIEDLAAIELDVPPQTWHYVCEPQEVKWNPQTVQECQFSLPYAVATAAYDKDVFLEAYTPQAMARQGVRDLMTKITAREDPGLQAFAARVGTRLEDGRRFSGQYLSVKGHPKNPFTEHDLISKFKKCVPYSACTLTDTVVGAVIEALLNLEKVDDVVSTLILPLTPK
ncbi:MAG: MmgE/PrpD family protein [Chloroflexi bacterium]|nr:MmgE/PrpD family protein [Chloroflexota bacterium]